MLNTFLTSILYFILLNRTHYQFYKNAPTVSLEAQMVSGSEVGESHSMEYIHIPKKGLLTKSLEFGKEAKKLWLIHHLFSMAIIVVINCLEWD